MPHYQPQTAVENAFAMLADLEGPVGRKARRWLRRRYTKRTMAEFHLRLARLGPGSIVIDLGANVGQITLQMAATGATVHAFEPDPFAFAQLRKTVGHLKNVVLHQAAVAVAGGQNLLQRRGDFADNPVLMSKMSSLTPIAPSLFVDGEVIPVETRAFREVLDSIGGPVALLKMDIEGAEFDILRMIFADPAAFDIDAIFCETHEFALVEQKPEVDRMIRASASLARPYVNLYWP